MIQFTINAPDWFIGLCGLFLIMQSINMLLDIYLKYLRDKIKRMFKK